MDPMLDAFEQVAREVTFAPLRIPLVCNLTGQMLDAGETMDAHYWRRHTREAVQFASGIQTLSANGYKLFLELGPSPALSNMGKRCLPANNVTWLSSLHQDHNDWHVLMESIATLYCKGRNLNWSGIEGDSLLHKVALPTYPFEREACWFDIEETDNGNRNHHEGGQTHPLLATHLALAHPASTHVWETALDKQRLPYLNDHRIQGAIAIPISVYVEMAQAATVETFGPGKHILSELELKKLLLLPEKGSQKVQVVLSSDAHEDVSFHVYSKPGQASPPYLAPGIPDQTHNVWTLHATGKIRHQ
jgi:acyl transferase domain-containing protein